MVSSVFSMAQYNHTLTNEQDERGQVVSSRERRNRVSFCDLMRECHSGKDRNVLVNENSATENK